MSTQRAFEIALLLRERLPREWVGDALLLVSFFPEEKRVGHAMRLVSAFQGRNMR